MKQHLLVDTDILIDLLRKKPQAIAFFKENAEQICFSTITVAEIYAGIRGDWEKSEVEKLFQAFRVLDVTDKIARTAGGYVNQYRSSHAVELPDALIAATSIVNDMKLCSLNIKHYPMVKGILSPCKKQ